jgi:hypothetical protein
MNVAPTLVVDPGDELSDPAFVPVVVPQAVRAVRAIVFGAAPDRAMLNYRCRQLLAVVDASPLASYITAVDPRRTYGFADPTLAAAATFRPIVTAIQASTVPAVVGTPLPPDATGVMRHTFRVEIFPGPFVQVTRTVGPSADVVTADLGPGLSVPVPLPRSGYSARFTDPISGQGWLITVLNRPQQGPAELLATLTTVGEPVLDALFGTDSAEPYATFRRHWLTGTTPARLAALVLATAYRTDERRGQP